MSFVFIRIRRRVRDNAKTQRSKGAKRKKKVFLLAPLPLCIDYLAIVEAVDPLDRLL